MADIIKSLFDIKFSILGFDVDISNIVTTVRSLCDFNDLEASEIWFIADLVNKFLIPLGLSLLTLFCLIELVRKSLEVERLSWERVAMTIIKYLFMAALVENSFLLLSTIMRIFNDALLGVSALLTDTSGMDSLGTTMYNVVDDADGFLMDIVTGIIVIILYIPFIGTIIGAIGQVFVRMAKVVLAFSVSPIPMALSVYEGLQSVSIRFAMSVAALGLEGILVVICVTIYSIALGSVSTGDAGADLGTAVSKLLGLLVANSLLMGTISVSSNLAEKWTGGQ